MLYGFVIAMSFFTIVNLKNVADAIVGRDVPVYIITIFVFVVTTPLVYVRRIEKLAFTMIIADFLILITAITILVYAVLHL